MARSTALLWSQRAYTGKQSSECLCLQPHVFSLPCPIQYSFTRPNSNFLGVLPCVLQACLETPCSLSACQLANADHRSSLFSGCIFLGVKFTSHGCPQLAPSQPPLQSVPKLQVDKFQNCLSTRWLAGPLPAPTTAAAIMQATTSRPMALSSCELWPQSQRALRSPYLMSTCWRAWGQGRAPCGSAMPSTAPAPGMWKAGDGPAAAAGQQDGALYCLGCTTGALKFKHAAVSGRVDVLTSRRVVCGVWGRRSILGVLSVHEGAGVPQPTAHDLGMTCPPAQQRHLGCTFWSEYCILRLSLLWCSCRQRSTCESCAVCFRKAL